MTSIRTRMPSAQKLRLEGRCRPIQDGRLYSQLLSRAVTLFLRYQPGFGERDVNKAVTIMPITTSTFWRTLTIWAHERLVRRAEFPTSLRRQQRAAHVGSGHNHVHDIIR